MAENSRDLDPQALAPKIPAQGPAGRTSVPLSGQPSRPAGGKRAARKPQSVSHGLLCKSAEAHDTLVAGIDEAGRGCLAGPVTAAAVAFADGFDLVGLTDSKLLSEKERLRLETEIQSLALGWGVGYAWMREIQEYNILQATLLAMARAVAALRKRLSAQPEALLIDGTFAIPHFYLSRYDLQPRRQKCIVDGDALIPSISAASVLAKNSRDRLMLHMDARYPQYGFARHKGYGTREHREALEKYGPCPLHRLDFHSVQPPLMEQGSLL